MGQSASQPQTSALLRQGLDPSLANLTKLTDGDLHVLLSAQPWDKAVVLQRAKLWKHHQKHNKKKDSEFYKEFEDSPESDLALRVNEISKELAQLRFSIVPSRVKEHTFWKTIFVMLQDRMMEYYEQNDLNGYQNGDSHEDEIKESMSTDTPIITNQSSSHNNSYAKVQKLQEALLQKDLIIQDLQRQLQLLEESVQVAQQEHHHPTPVHAGTWQITQDAQDFLSYPEEVKDNMRQEKQRRLTKVREEMSFILDSDEPQDSPGKWTCCGSQNYDQPCSKRQ